MDRFCSIFQMIRPILTNVGQSSRLRSQIQVHIGVILKKTTVQILKQSIDF